MKFKQHTGKFISLLVVAALVISYVLIYPSVHGQGNRLYDQHAWKATMGKVGDTYRVPDGQWMATWEFRDYTGQPNSVTIEGPEQLKRGTRQLIAASRIGMVYIGSVADAAAQFQDPTSNDRIEAGLLSLLVVSLLTLGILVLVLGYLGMQQLVSKRRHQASPSN